MCAPPQAPGTMPLKQTALAEDTREHPTSPAFQHLHPKHGPREPMRTDSKHHLQLKETSLSGKVSGFLAIWTSC